MSRVIVVLGVFFSVLLGWCGENIPNLGAWKRFLDPPGAYVAFERRVVKDATHSLDGFTVECYTQANGPTTSQRVMMAIPQGAKGKLPVVVVPFYYPEAMLGVNPVDGTFEVPNRLPPGKNLREFAAITYMSDLAKRDYITISADAYHLTYDAAHAPANSWEKWKHAGEALKRDWPMWTGVGKLMFDTMLLIDLAVADPRVDANRIGMIGHSLGGKMAFYAGCWDPRVKVIVASDFGINWDQTNWQDVWYWGDKLAEARQLKLDHADLLSFSGGKPFCLIAGQYDNEESGVTMRKARGYEKNPEKLKLINHATGHRPPRAATEAGYRFLDRYLQTRSAK